MDVQNLRIALFDALNPYGDEEGKLPRALIERLLRQFSDEKLHLHLGKVLQEVAGKTDSVDIKQFVNWVCGGPEDRPSDRSASKKRLQKGNATLKKVQCFRTKEQSMLLGVSIAFLCTDFLAEVEYHFGKGADPDYHEINPVMLYGPKARGFGVECPRDKKRAAAMPMRWMPNTLVPLRSCFHGPGNIASGPWSPRWSTGASVRS